MSATIPYGVPDSFTSGELVQWYVSLADYSPDDYTLSYVFVNASGYFTESTAIASGSDFLVSITVADAPTAGTYHWQETVTNSSDATDVHVTAKGTTLVNPQFGAAAYDDRSNIKQALDALEAAIISRASEDQLSMSIGGRSISKMSLAEMIEAKNLMKAEYARELAAERLANGQGNPGVMRVRF